MLCLEAENNLTSFQHRVDAIRRARASTFRRVIGDEKQEEKKKGKERKRCAEKAKYTRTPSRKKESGVTQGFREIGGGRPADNLNRR